MRRVVGKAEVGFLLLIAVLVLAGCGNRSSGQDQTDPEPTVTPLAEVAVIPTFTPTVPPPDPTPTEEPTATPSPTPTPVLIRSHVNTDEVNLRSGPGVTYDKVGELDENTTVRPVSQFQARNGWLWLKLDTGDWIFADLVDEIPPGLPVETNVPTPPSPTTTPTPVPPTAVPATATPVPTSTPVPVEGDWDWPVGRNRKGSFWTPDHLKIEIQGVIHGNDDRMQTYIERRGGQNCDGCLVIQLDIVVGDNANSNEYVVQGDFKLWEGDSESDAKEFKQVQCDHASGLRQTVQQARALVYGLSDSGERLLCFDGVKQVSTKTRLAYSPSPNTLYKIPTPTPAPSGSVKRASKPREEEQAYRTGWSVFYLLLGI